jgi:hypothetical protein
MKDIVPGAQTRRGDGPAGECFAWQRRLTGHLISIAKDNNKRLCQENFKALSKASADGPRAAFSLLEMPPSVVYRFDFR